MRKSGGVFLCCAAYLSAQATSYVAGPGPYELANVTNSVRTVAWLGNGELLVNYGCCSVARLSAAGRLTRIAGSVVQGLQTEPLPPMDARLTNLSGLVVDAQGAIFIEDRDQNRIRRIDPRTGQLTTYAGTGTAASTGDGGPATLAGLALANPTGVGGNSLAVDRQGRLFVAERERIRVIEGNGTIRTAAVVEGLRGIALDAAGNLLAIDTVSLRSVEGSGATRVVYRTAFGTLNGVAANERGVFVAEGFQGRVARVDLTNGTASPVVENQTSPATLLAAGDQLYFTEDAPPRRLRVVSLATGAARTVHGEGENVGDGGPARNAVINAGGLALEGDRLIQTQGSSLRTISLATGRIGRLPVEGLGNVASVAADGRGSLYLFDVSARRIRRAETGQPGFSEVVALPAVGSFGLSATGSLLALADGETLWIADQAARRLFRYRPGGGLESVAGTGGAGRSADGTSAGSAQVTPIAVAVSPAREIYFLDQERTVRRIRGDNGTLETVAGGGGAVVASGPALSMNLGQPQSLGFDSRGRLVVGSDGFITRVDPGTGQAELLWGRVGALRGTLGPPDEFARYPLLRGLALDAGDQMYVAAGDRIYRIGPMAGGGEPAAQAVAHAGTFQAGAMAPGLVVSVFGERLGPAAPAAGTPDANRFPTEAGGTRVLFDGVPAPVLLASEGQVNTVVPFAIAGQGRTRVQLVREGRAGAERELPVRPANPGWFANGGIAACLNPDGSLHGPQAPARPGTVLACFGTGLGALDPAPVEGAIVQAPLPRLMEPVQTQVGILVSETLYAGAAPLAVAGLYQVNLRVPDGLAAGTYPLLLRAGEGVSPAIASVVVR